MLQCRPKGQAVHDELVMFSGDITILIASYAYSGLNNVLLPNNVITVTDNVSGLIQIYTLVQFAARFDQKGEKDKKQWFIWSAQGWTRIIDLEPVVITKNNAVSELDLLADDSGNQRSGFVIVRNNQNLLSCIDTMLLAADPSKTVLHVPLVPLIVAPPINGFTISGKQIPAISELVKDGIECNFPVTLACRKYECGKMFDVDEMMKIWKNWKHAAYCSTCVDEKVERFARQRIEDQKRDKEKKALYDQCSHCAKPLQELEKWNFDLEEEEGKDWAHCNSCFQIVKRLYEKKEYHALLVPKPFEIISAKFDLHHSGHRELYEQMFLGFDVGSDGGFDVFVHKDVGHVLVQLCFMMAHRLGYKKAYYSTGNYLISRCELHAISEVMSEKFGCHDEIEDPFEYHTKEFERGQGFVVEHYWISQDGKHLYRPHYQQRNSNWHDRLTSFDLPCTGYRMITEGSSFQMGVGGIIVFS